MMRLLLSTIALLAGLALPAAEPDPLTVRRHGYGYRYPQAGWTVLHIEGEPYDRGYQHGQLLADEINDYVLSLAAQQSKAAPADAWAITRTMVSAVFLRKFDRECLLEMQGIADGAAARGAKFHERPIDLLDIVCLNVQMEYETLDNANDATPTGLEGLRLRKTASPPKADHCSAFAATGPATADGQLVIGHITMTGLANALAANVWIDVKPSQGHRVVMQGFPGAIWSSQDYYLNSAGIVLTETTIRQTRFHAEGVPLTCRCRRAMQYGSTIDDVVKILSEGNNGLYTNEWLIGDANTNEIAMLQLGTSATKLHRSGRNEWLLPGTEGFYWGCNNTKDLNVRQDTHASLAERPQDLSWKPSDRDKAWLKLYRDHRGKVDAEFGKLAFRTSPLAGKPSFDAKVTTAAMVKDLKSHAIYGPPSGKLWEVTQREHDKYHEVRSLVPNDWTVLGVRSPAVVKTPVISDFVEELPELAKDPHTVPAWQGTLLPQADRDIWLTAGFAAYERIVSLEIALKERSKGKLSAADHERLDLALFQHQSAYLAALAAKPSWRAQQSRKIPSGIDVELDRDRWHTEQVSLGVLRLVRLRKLLGDDKFFNAIREFGRGFAGKEVAEADFADHFGRKIAELDESISTKFETRPVNVTGWMHDPEHAVIVYGTLADVAGNRAAALELQRAYRVKWTLYDIPLLPDTDATAEALKGKHVLLIGRPAVNASTRSMASAFPITWGHASTSFGKEHFAHERTAVIAGGVNPHDARYSVVVIAGHSADATYHAAQALPNAPAAEVLLFLRGTTAEPKVK